MTMFEGTISNVCEYLLLVQESQRFKKLPEQVKDGRVGHFPAGLVVPRDQGREDVRNIVHHDVNPVGGR